MKSSSHYGAKAFSCDGAGFDGQFKLKCVKSSQHSMIRAGGDIRIAAGPDHAVS